MREALWIGVVMATLLTAGCLGGVDAAEIPEQTLQDNDWREDDVSEESVALGLGEIVTKDYRPQNSMGASGAMVVTTTDVPILDERRFLPQAIEDVEEERNMQFNKADTTTIQLPELGIEVEGDVYNFQKSGVDGKAVVFTSDACDSFVVGVGYGVTGGGGFGADPVTYQEARRVVSQLVC